LQWRGGDWDPQRSVDFGLLSCLLNVDGIAFHSLQYPLEALPPQLTNLAQRSLLATARAMMSLDLVISIDSVSAHLAGAMGIPTWVLLPQHCDWRWVNETGPTATTPWYPSMRLFRQTRQGDWSTVLARVRSELRTTARRDTRSACCTAF
jgi:hypothetical protein